MFVLFVISITEVMLLGFISLLLTVGQTPISKICISKAVAATWHPCKKKQESKLSRDHENSHRRLLLVSDPGESIRRVLASASDDKCAAKACLTIFWSYLSLISRMFTLVYQ